MVASKDVARVLLEHGADPNWRDEGGNTPIHCVIRSRIVGDPAEFVRVLSLVRTWDYGILTGRLLWTRP
jgi:hypothetical protein